MFLYIENDVGSPATIVHNEIPSINFMSDVIRDLSLSNNCFPSNKLS